MRTVVYECGCTAGGDCIAAHCPMCGDPISESHRTITPELLTELGFVSGDGRQWRWKLDVDTKSSYPTRVFVMGQNVFGKYTYHNLLIEQAEFTGELSEGIGESDWSWDSSTGVDIVLKGERELRLLLQLLTKGEI